MLRASQSFSEHAFSRRPWLDITGLDEFDYRRVCISSQVRRLLERVLVNLGIVRGRAPSSTLLHDFSAAESPHLIATHNDLARFKVPSGYQIEPIDHDLSAAAVLQEIVHFDNARA